MKLTPEDIQNHFKELGAREAITLLKEWIFGSADNSIRRKALNILESIDNKENFKFYENLFLSDEDSEIQKGAGQILRRFYLTHPRIIPLLEFSLRRLTNWELKFISLESLNEIEKPKSRKIIKDYLQQTIQAKFEDRIQEFPKEVFNQHYETPLSDNILEICFQFIMYDYYINVCGYNATIRNGYIVLLDCEGYDIKRLSEIVGIFRLKELQHLILSNCLLETLEGVQHLKNLKVLKLRYNYVKKLDYFEELKNLEELDLSYNYIEKIENLNSLKQLRRLSLQGNKITEIQRLDLLERLEILDLSHNKIKEIEGLDTLKELKRLILSHNEIERISGLDNLKNLNHLLLNFNAISTISGLEAQETLKSLNLCNNQIKKIQNISHLQKLIKLELSNNQIEAIKGVDQLQSLQGLFLDNNKISKISGVDGLDNLITLFLKDNQITEYKELNLRSLRYLFLNDNPLSSESARKYKNTFSRYP